MSTESQVSIDNATHPSRRMGLLPKNLYGHRLSQTSTIIQADESVVSGNVIALIVTTQHQPFVTGVLQNNGGWLWGHYYYTLGEALHDYMVRVKGIRVSANGHKSHQAPEEPQW